MYKATVLQLLFFCVILNNITSGQQPKLMLPIGHTDAVRYVQFSPDGKRVVTASLDKTAKIWDAITGSLLADLKGHTDVVNFAQFSPDGKKILTVSGSLLTLSQDSSVKIWDAESGSFLADLKHNSYVVSAQFSPDGKKIVTASRDNIARVWDAVTYKLLFALAKHTDVINSAQFSPDGKRIVTSSADRTVKLWDVVSGRYLLDLRSKNYMAANSVQFSPDGKKIIAVYKGGGATIWDAVSYGMLYDMIGVNSAQFSSDGKKIVTTNLVNIAVLWDAVTGKALSNLNHDEAVVSAQFSPDGKKIVTASYDGTAKIWNADNGKAIDTLAGHEDWVVFAQFSNNGKKVVTASTDGTAIVWDAASGKLLADLTGHTQIASSIQMSPDGKTIVTASYDGTAKIWDAVKGTLLANLSGHYAGLLSAAFSSDGKKIVTASADSTAKIWDANADTAILDLTGHTDWVLSAEFSPDNKRVVTSSKDRTAKIWDAVTGKMMIELKGHTAQVNSAGFSPDGKKVVTASNDKTVKIWDAFSGKLLNDLKGHKYFVNSAQFSPRDGKKIVSASWDKTARVWDAVTGDSLFELKKHKDWIYSARFSKDGNKIITASNDGTVKVWDATDGSLTADLQADSYGVNSADFSPDGKKIILTGWSNTCQVWDADTHGMLYTFFAVDSTDYLVADKENRYDGTQAARKLLYFTCGTEVIELEQVKDQLWVPGLGERIMNGEIINAKTLNELSICGYTPETRDSIGAGEYRFRIIPRGGGLGETVVSVNGIEAKRVKPQQIKNKNGSYELVIKKNEIDSFLVDGKENPVTVKAYTANNTVASRGAIVQVDKTTSSKTPPNLYAVVVGVSDYKGNEIDLKYAAKDATDFSRAVTSSARKLLNMDGKEHVFSYNLTTAPDRYRMPEKKTIKAILDSIGRKATANDILVIFFAGHGKMVGDGANKQFYFLTADASSLATTDAFKDVGISTTELMEWMKPQNIKAQKRVLIFDACNSGQVIKDFVKLGNVNQNYAAARSDEKAEQIKAIDKLNEKSGFFILSASTSDQSAYEMSQFSQGLLTYSLLKAIKLNPAILDENKYLNIQKWFSATSESVSEIIKQMTDNEKRQEPQIVTNTNFNIGVVDNEVMANIKFPQEMPLFAASNFQNSDEAIADDDLELSKMVNMQLSSIAARGDESKILFMTSTNSPDAYSLTGRYTVTGNEIKITVNIKQNKAIKFKFEVSGTKDKLAELSSTIALRAADWAGSKK